jgi:glycerol-3-phosphate acyltransferase PlsY
MLYVFWLVVSYLLGAVSFGLVITRVFGHGDLRKVGSGNIGATNVMRVGGLRLAGLVWILDMAKAIIAVLVGMALGGVAFGAWCGFAAIVGHIFPVWLRFRGGKGISCLFGVFLAINPLMFVFCGLEWLVTALTSGYSSLGALVVLVVAPVFGFAQGTEIGWPMLAMSVLCFWRHKDNILRLIQGTESKIGWKWKK